MRPISSLTTALTCLLLSACIGGNQDTDNNSTDNDKPSSLANDSCAYAPTADSPTDKANRLKPGDFSLYVATSNTKSQQQWETQLLKDGKQIFLSEGRIAWIDFVDQHLLFSLDNDGDKHSYTIYQDCNKTDLVFGPDVWIFSGTKNAYFDNNDGKVVNLKGLTEFSYTPDNDGQSPINEVIDKGGELFISSGQPAKIYQNNNLVFDDAKENVYPSDLQYDNGSLYFRGITDWQGNKDSHVIFKDKKAIAGNLCPEGKFFVFNNDIYTTDFTHDDDERKTLIVKNGSEKHTVSGGLENMQIGFYSGKVYTWSVDYYNGNLLVVLTENFKQKARLNVAPKDKDKFVFCNQILFHKGDVFLSVVDFSVPDVVKIYQNDCLLLTVNAKTYEDDSFSRAEATFAIK